MKLYRSETGAETIEYIIALTILLVVFLMAGRILQESAEERADESMKSSQDNVPHITTSDTLCSLGADACK